MTDVDAVLARVVDDLDVDGVQRLAVGRARVRVDDHDLELQVTTRGRFLLRITETAFVATGPDWDAVAHGPVSLRVGHAGMVARRGVRVTVRRGGGAARGLALDLGGSRALEAAMLPLDFTDFTIREHEGRLVARIVLMGASMTRFRIPPTATYTRLHDDQRDALLATVAALEGHWSRR